MSDDKKLYVYLDSNSTTELSQEVSGVIMDIVINNIHGNPSSSHGYGIRSRALVEASRHSLAKALGCLADEIYFTGGGTESNNLALRGLFNSNVDTGGELVISAAEHSSVYNTAHSITGGDFNLIPLLPDGNLDLDLADKVITEDTSLVSVMLANNETGVIFPVKEIVSLAHSKGALVHCDAVQAFGKIPIDIKSLGVDLLSISGHKAHALTGVGALYVRKGIKLHPILTGGKQESGVRPGTENYIGITSLGAVASEIVNDGINSSSGLRDAFEKALVKKIPDIFINGGKVARVFNTTSVTFKGIHASVLVDYLSERGIFVSAGSACSSNKPSPSRTLLAMGLSENDALSTIRFSFSKYSTPYDTSTAIDECIKVVSSLRE